MKMPGRFRYQRIVIGYTLILLIFLSVMVSVIVSHHREMMEQMHEDAQQELKLMGNFARDALLRNDYSAFEQFLNNWAGEHKEIIELKASAPNNFVLVNFHREAAPALTFQLKEKVDFEGKTLIFLEMTKDMSAAQMSMVGLRYRLITGAILMTAIFGLVLWFFMRKLALAPMEKEILMKDQAEKKFRMLLESTPDSMIYSDRQGKIIMVNGETEKIFGYPRKELEGKDIEVLMPERYRDRHREFRKNYMGSAGVRPMGHLIELYGRTKDGREFPADISVRIIKSDEEPYFLSLIRDISERKIREEKIKRSYSFQRTISKILRISLEPISLEEQLHRILDVILSITDLSFQSRGAIYLIGEDTRSMNLAATHGFPEPEASGPGEQSVLDSVCGRTAAERRIMLVNCNDRQAGKMKVCSHAPAHRHYCVPIISGDRTLGIIELIVQHDHRSTKDEEEFLISVANTVAGIIEHDRLNLERQHLQEELAQGEKMSALGRLTANVAHEIRNPLTLIGGFARKLSRHIYEGGKDREYANIIVAQVSRLEKILKSVLTFSREAALDRAEHDINAVIEEVIKSCQNECRKKVIRIERHMGQLPLLSMDKDQVWMVLNNIFSNALDAMSDGGTFTVSTDTDSVYGKNYIVVTLSDTGTGIPEHQLHAIFEPFYTTKLIGRGTGLGLSISKKIMEDHGGFIKVRNNAGKGTSFSLFFPLK